MSVAVLIALALGVAGIVHFAAAERSRALRDWQVRLSIVADGRFDAVDRWLDDQFATLGGLAENASLQIYLTEIRAAGGEAAVATDALGQIAYLETLLEVTAERSGFRPARNGRALPANVERTGGGLALLDQSGAPVAATEGFPSLGGEFGQFVAAADKGEAAVLDLRRAVQGRLVMAFLVPIFAVQGDGPADRVGSALAVKEVAEELFPLLSQPGEAARTAETLLVRARAGQVEYLSPLADGKPALALRLSAATEGLAAAFALREPGAFAILRDYAGEEVLATSRAFQRVPWTLVRKISRAEALGAEDARLLRLTVGLFLLMALVVAAFLAVWRHGASRRAAAAATRHRDLATRYEALERLARLVTDSQPNIVFIADAEGRVRFANKAAAEAARMEPRDLLDKSLASLLGAAEAERYLAGNRTALEEGRIVLRVDRTGEAEERRVRQVLHIPIAESAILPRGALVVDQDISDAVAERERRERTLQELVRTLVDVVDQRDPHAARHSRRTGLLAGAIAREMGLASVLVETAETAGRLTNLGKILVSESVLTKEDNLTAAEVARVRAGIRTSADLLEGIEFDGPVVETLRQVQERWDGAGQPDGRAGEAILVTARIVAVANAFVALISPRAHRPALDIDRALAGMLDQIGGAYDRAVVGALVNYMDNREGRAAWTEVAQPA
ncbi:MAG: PAS domain-containing protein [Rhodospirillaceae bacterium]|nr:PAS domain-containing protein [Rhodospirillaceae bacterium]